MTLSGNTENWQDDEALTRWLNGAKANYQNIQYAGAPPSATAEPAFRRWPLLRPAFALAASIAVVSLVWFGPLSRVPDAGGPSQWEQPADPTSARDLSSLARGVRQRLSPASVIHPIRPQDLQFRLPNRPKAPQRSGFSDSVETGMLISTDLRQLG